MEEISADLVAAARRGKRDAVVEVLAAHYPVVWRIATSLTGREDVGRGVVKYIMRRSLHALPHWTDDGAPTRWFHHHTLLTTRRAQKHQPDATNDSLLEHRRAAPEPSYIAFIRALRSLPMQQREAFILHHGEKLDLRSIGVAMDCSTTAAQNHLREASEQLRKLSQQEFDAHVQRMQQIHQRLGPDEEMSVGRIRGQVRRYLLPWMIRRVVRTIATLLLLALTLWTAWWAWRIVGHSMGSGG